MAKKNLPAYVRTIGKFDAFDFESITVAATAIGFTAATFDPSDAASAQRAVLSVETAQIRYRYDGTDPTSLIGHILEPGDTLVVDGYTNINAFKAIRTGATSGTIRVTFER